MKQLWPTEIKDNIEQPIYDANMRYSQDMPGHVHYPVMDALVVRMEIIRSPVQEIRMATSFDLTTTTE